MTISVNVDSSKFSSEVQKVFEKGARFERVITKAMRQVATFGYQNLRDRLRSGTGTAPRYNTGGLYRSFNISGFEKGLGDEVGAIRLFSDAVQAAVLERGTKGKGGDLPDIVSKRGRGKFLAIPLRRALEQREEAGFFMSGVELVETTGSALTKAGRLQGRFAGRSLRDSKELFVFKSHNGKLFLAVPGKKNKPPKLLFRLLPSVSIKPHPYLRPTAEAIADKINADFPRMVNDLITNKTEGRVE